MAFQHDHLSERSRGIQLITFRHTKPFVTNQFFDLQGLDDGQLASPPSLRVDCVYLLLRHPIDEGVGPEGKRYLTLGRGRAHRSLSRLSVQRLASVLCERLTARQP